MKRKKQMSIEEAADRLAANAVTHLAALPEEEQDARVAAFAKLNFKKRRETRAKSSGSSRIRESRASVRER
jgi:hypothetical protein